MTSSSSFSTDIVIIGAGPTGLMLACQLALYPGVSFRIIDKSAGCTDQSRALVVHARSLEVFAQLNLIEQAIAQGIFADRMKFFFHGQYTFQVDLTRIRAKQQPLLTRYPYALFLEQSVTERLLESFLTEHNIQVERETGAVDITDIDTIDGTGVEVTLTTGERIRAKYVCACDGARSIVRHKLNLPFDGRTYSESLFVADCKVENVPVASSEAAIFIESSGLAGVIPMANHRWRLLGSVHEETSVSIADVANILQTRSRHPDIKIIDCSWVSVYRSHHRHITSFRPRSSYFLLGDAAHIHSPVGGQGMNTGLQDAHNLAWKLAYVLTHSAHDRLLDTYHNERFDVAKALVNTTDRAFSFISSPQWFVRFIRLYVAPYFLRFIVQPILNSSHTVRQAAFHRLSQLGISYRSPAVYDYGASAGEFQPSTPLPGDRFPYVIFEPCYYHFVICEHQRTAQVDLFIELIKVKYSTVIRIYDTREQNIPFRFEGAILVRPDGYIAYRTNTFNMHHFQSYFAQYFPSETM